ncbi:MAG: ribonuclease HI family protein [Candidatus Omnitrophica bacterium]|nr:ribonuclease HI family protein [Candidatus Omnitrophota bacterium]MBU2044415.1 ribonuclease HI family protein [Candidatus Omnitrophota bacterium]MBU2251377.1 ribonuclease HI family protein [Candidatus Omnitrophota bacterium]MBU2473745.1 ribonuclease HI family protein [Candidatus Omnitrophota bacterium]
MTVYIDGASVGNPGKSGIGYLIYDQGRCLKKESIYLGVQSNNFAEYMALIFSLAEITAMGQKEAAVFSDSELICEQIKGNYKVKNQNLYPLYVLAKTLISKLDKFTITHIDREKNQEADKLAKQATGFLV